MQMLRQFWSATIAVELSVALGWAIILWLASRYYSKALSGQKVTVKADYLKAPTTTALTVLGLVVPILVALTSYLYVTEPNANYGSLLSTIILYFGVLILAIWETFAILQKATPQDTVDLTYPDDRKFVTALGLMYGMLVLGLLYFAYFFLVEVRPNAPTAGLARWAGASYFVQRPAIKIDNDRTTVYGSWGTPARGSSQSVEYDTDKGVIAIEFDADGKVRQITERRR